MSPTPSPNHLEPTGVGRTPALSVEIAQIVSLSTRGQIELPTAVAGASNNTRHIIATCAGPPLAVAAFLRQVAEQLENPVWVGIDDGDGHVEMRGPFYDTVNLPMDQTGA